MELGPSLRPLRWALSASTHRPTADPPGLSLETNRFLVPEDPRTTALTRTGQRPAERGGGAAGNKNNARAVLERNREPRTRQATGAAHWEAADQGPSGAAWPARLRGSKGGYQRDSAEKGKPQTTKRLERPTHTSGGTQKGNAVLLSPDFDPLRQERATRGMRVPPPLMGQRLVRVNDWSSMARPAVPRETRESGI